MIDTTSILALHRAVMLIVFFTCSIISASAQCPPEDNCGPWSEQSTHQAGTVTADALPTCHWSFTYRTRVCNGVPEYILDNIEFEGTCEVFESLQIEQYNYNAAIEHAVQSFLGTTIPYNIPLCSSTNPHPQRALIYTASCGIWLACEYSIIGAGVCDPGYNLPGPDANSKVIAYKWQSCGTTCCKRTFEYCRVGGIRPQDPIVTSARQIAKEQIGPCSEQGSYSKPCESGC